MEDNRFETPAPQGGLLGEDQIERPECAAVVDVGRVEYIRRDRRVQPVLVKFDRKGVVLLGQNNDLGIEFSRIWSECTRAAGYEDADIAFGPVVRVKSRLDCALELIPGQRDFDSELVAQSVIEHAELGLRPEQLPVEGAEMCPRAVAVEEPVVERADPGVGLVDERAIDPDEGHDLQSSPLAERAGYFFTPRSAWAAGSSASCRRSPPRRSCTPPGRWPPRCP